MFTIIGLMLTGMLLGFLLRKQKLSGIHKVITVLIYRQRYFIFRLQGGITVAKTALLPNYI